MEHAAFMEIEDAPPELPSGNFVKLACDGQGTYRVVTARLGYVVGARLAKGGSKPLPNGPTSGLHLDAAIDAMNLWEDFCEDHEGKKGKKYCKPTRKASNNLRTDSKESERNLLQHSQKSLL
jgi:hypothetical protein